MNKLKKNIAILLSLMFLCNIASGLTIYFGTTFYGNHIQLTFAENGYYVNYLYVGDDYFIIDDIILNVSGIGSTFPINVSMHDSGNILFANSTVLRFNATYTGNVWFNFTGNNTNATYTVYDVTNDDYILSNQNSDIYGKINFNISFSGTSDIKISLDGYYYGTSDKSIFLYPNAIGFQNQANAFGDSPNWKCVDESPHDSDTTYIYWSSTGSSSNDLYNLENSTNIGTINNITYHIIIKSTTSTSGRFWDKFRTYNTIYGNVGQSYDTTHLSYTEFTYTYNNNFYTGNPWTWDEINNLEIGVILQPATVGNSVRVTSMFLEVNYTSLPTGIDIETLDAEGVEERNATFVGTLNEDGGHYQLPYYFEYGGSTSYGNTTSTDFIVEDEIVKINVSSLAEGSIYHYRIVTQDIYANYYYGLDKSFKTKPDSPVNLTVNVSEDGLSGYLQWNKGAGAYKSIIIRNTSTYPATVNDGDEIYNGTLSFYTDYPLEYGVNQYYRVWSWANGIYSDGYSSASILNLLAPAPPYNGNSEYHAGTDTINFTWNRGNGSDREIVLYKNGSWPTTVTDGNIVQNSTNLYYNTSVVDNRYYSIWSYNNTLKIYSPTGLNIEWGKLIIYAFMQSNPYWELENYTIQIVNTDSLETFYSTNNNNPVKIDVLDIPYSTNAENCIITVNDIGYFPSDRIQPLLANRIYNFSFYLAFDDDSETTPDESKLPTLPEQNESTAYLYVLIVEDQYSVRLESVEISAFFYNNESGNWDLKGEAETDGNGQSEMYLIAHVKHRFILQLDGYVTETAFWTPTDELFTHTFKLTQAEPIEDTDFLFKNLSYTLSPTVSYHTSNITINLTVNDLDCLIEYYRMVIYYENLTNNSGRVLVYYSNVTANSCGGTITYDTNTSTAQYHTYIYIKKTGFSEFSTYKMYQINVRFAPSYEVGDLFGNVLFWIIAIVVTILGTGFAFRLIGGNSIVVSCIIFGVFVAINPSGDIAGINAIWVLILMAIVTLIMFLLGKAGGNYETG